jgi:O-antigen/teichoic acid export membrane protein
LGILYLFFNALAQLPETIMLLKNDTRMLIRFTCFTTGLSLVLFAIFYVSFPFLKFLMAGLLVIAIIKCIVLIRMLYPLPKIHFSEVRFFLKFSLPFIFISILGFGMEMTDGILVVHFFDESVFPVYKYGAREIPFSSLLMNSLSVALIPMLSGSSGSVPELKRQVQKYMHMLFPLSILFIWISHPAFLFFYNASFSESAFIFNLYLLIIGSRILLPHSILMARGHQNWVLVSGMAELVANIVLSVWWVNIWGLYGLAAATVAAYYVQKAVMLYALHKVCHVSLKEIIPVNWWLLYQLIIGLSLVLNYIWLH